MELGRSKGQDSDHRRGLSTLVELLGKSSTDCSEDRQELEAQELAC